jgi:hypothetical protein
MDASRTENLVETFDSYVYLHNFYKDSLIMTFWILKDDFTERESANIHIIYNVFYICFFVYINLTFKASWSIYMHVWMKMIVQNTDIESLPIFSCLRLP